MFSIFRACRRVMVPALIVGVAVFSLSGAGFGAGDLSGHWASVQMNAWIGQGIIKGYPDGTVRPDASVTRAEFMAMVNKAYRLAGSSGKGYKDVGAGSWYASVIDTAATAGYIGGYPDGTMRPDARISRNEAAVIIMKASGLSGNASASTVFSDSGSIPSWAQAAVGAAYRKGAMSGYPDGTFGGNRFISRAEAVISLSRSATVAVKPTVPTAPAVPVNADRIYSDPGTYGSDSTQTIKGNATIKVSGVTLNNMVIEGDLIIAKEVSSGDATLKNVTVKGTTYIYGGGPNSVHFTNVTAGRVNVSRESGTVRLVVSGSSVIDKVIAKSDLKLEETSLSRSGATYLSIESGFSSGVDVELIGASLDEIDMSASGSTLTADSRSAVTRFTVSARDTVVTLDSGSTVSRLIADAAVRVRGKGTITRADVNVGNVTFETTPKDTTVKSGVTAPATSNPYIQSFSPSDGSTSASLSTDIVITFSETVRRIDDTALSNSNVYNLITLRSGGSSGNNVSFDATVRTSSGKTVITIDPRSALSASTRYYVSIEDVEDSDNLRTTGSRSAMFTTVGNTAPRIESFSPSNGSTKVAVGSNIILTFSETVRKISGNTTLSDSNVDSLITFRKTNSAGTVMPFDATVTVSGGKTVITVNPTGDLAYGQLYFVSVSDIEDSDDLSLTGTTYATFTTASLADPVPTIESISPTNGSADALIGTNIVISFSEIMRALNDTPLENNTVDSLVTFKTPNSTGATVNFDAKVNTVNGKTVITIDPESDLLPNTSYYVAVTGVEDTANQTVSGNVTFTTAKAPADPVPTIESINPSNSSVDVPIDKTIIISYSEIMRAVSDAPLDDAAVKNLISLKAGDSAVEFSASVSTATGKTIITIAPLSNLMNNTIYSVAVSAVEDSADQAVSGTAVFTTVKATPPVQLTADQLKGLTMDPNLISFSGEKTSYDASVAYEVSSVTITPTAADGNTVQITGAQSGVSSPLEVGPNTISITVSKEKCTSLVYTISITRGKAPADPITPGNIPPLPTEGA